jgi:hypothetical protein
MSNTAQDNFDNTLVQTEYAIFSVCNEIQELMNRFDRGEHQEVFFTQAADLIIAAAKMDSLAQTLQLHIKKVVL